MSDTPRTDGMEYYFSNHDSCAGESIYTVIGDNDVTWSKGFEGYLTPSDFSRQLERELAEVTKQRNELAIALNQLMDVVATTDAAYDDRWATEIEINDAWHAGNNALKALKGGQP